MKRFTVVILFTILALSVLALAFAPLPAKRAQIEQPLPADQILNAVLVIVVGFGSLVGVAALITVLINLLKTFGIVQDGTAAQWSAGLSLLAFIALVAFRVFQPGITLEILDGYAAQIAQIALFMLGFLVQIISPKSIHGALKASAVPLLSKSHSG